MSKATSASHPSTNTQKPTSTVNNGTGPRPPHPQQTAIKSYVNLHPRRSQRTSAGNTESEVQSVYRDPFYVYPHSPGNHNHATPRPGQVLSQQPNQSHFSTTSASPAEIYQTKEEIARQRLARKQYAFSVNSTQAKQMMAAFADLNFQINSMEMEQMAEMEQTRRMEQNGEFSESDSSSWVTTDDSENSDDDEVLLGSDDQDDIAEIPLPSDPPPSSLDPKN